MAEGPQRVLVLVYGFFTLAAGARSGVQLATEASQAPLAYTLSGVAAVIYLIGGVLIARIPRGERLAERWCRLELVGVVVVGLASYAMPSAFPDATVWSHFGSGYWFVPLALPLLALVWLHRREAGELVDERVVPKG